MVFFGGGAPVASRGQTAVPSSEEDFPPFSRDEELTTFARTTMERIRLETLADGPLYLSLLKEPFPILE
jgi:hypothetical protein